MAPGVIQNSENIINNTIDPIIPHNGGILNDLLVEVKVCPIDHLKFEALENGFKKIDEVNKEKEFDNSVHDEDRVVEDRKAVKKPVRKVIKPKVLKNIESRDYLYDRLYDTTCPRVVSEKFDKILLLILLDLKKSKRSLVLEFKI